MSKIERHELKIISRYSNLSEEQLDELLIEHSYSSNKDWVRMLKAMLISIGSGLSLAGIIFFFAYNWESMPTYAKFVLSEGLLIACFLIYALIKTSTIVKQLLLLAMSVLVGVNFALFGQVYQTGANAYQFFMMWALSISIWVLISNFPPLWLLWTILINLTFFLYETQTFEFSPVVICIILGLINTAAVGIPMLFKAKVPLWYEMILLSATVFIFTIGFVIFIVDPDPRAANILLILVYFSVGFALYRKAMLDKQVYILALLALSVMVVGVTYAITFMRLDSVIALLLFIGLFVVGGLTMVSKYLLDLQKKWNNEQK